MRQLSFAFLDAGRHLAEGFPAQEKPADHPNFGAVVLRRVDPKQNIARFYSMSLSRDLFGSVVLARQWGRIGIGGRTRLAEYPGEGNALAALVAMEQRKRRRGYELIQKGSV